MVVMMASMIAAIIAVMMAAKMAVHGDGSGLYEYNDGVHRLMISLTMIINDLNVDDDSVFL